MLVLLQPQNSAKMFLFFQCSKLSLFGIALCLFLLLLYLWFIIVFFATLFFISVSSVL